MPGRKKLIYNDEVFTQEFHDKYLPVYEAIRAKRDEITALEEELAQAMLSIGAVNHLEGRYSPYSHFRVCINYLESKKKQR